MQERQTRAGQRFRTAMSSIDATSATPLHDRTAEKRKIELIGSITVGIQFCILDVVSEPADGFFRSAASNPFLVAEDDLFPELFIERPSTPSSSQVHQSPSKCNRSLSRLTTDCRKQNMTGSDVRDYVPSDVRSSSFVAASSDNADKHCD
jgi:hypothetical protein